MNDCNEAPIESVRFGSVMHLCGLVYHHEHNVPLDDSIRGSDIVQFNANVRDRVMDAPLGNSWKECCDCKRVFYNSKMIALPCNHKTCFFCFVAKTSHAAEIFGGNFEYFICQKCHGGSSVFGIRFYGEKH